MAMQRRATSRGGGGAGRQRWLRGILTNDQDLSRWREGHQLWTRKYQQRSQRQMYFVNFMKQSLCPSALGKVVFSGWWEIFLLLRRSNNNKTEVYHSQTEMCVSNWVKAWKFSRMNVWWDFILWREAWVVSQHLLGAALGLVVGPRPRLAAQSGKEGPAGVEKPRPTCLYSSLKLLSQFSSE